MAFEISRPCPTLSFQVKWNLQLLSPRLAKHWLLPGSNWLRMRHKIWLPAFLQQMNQQEDLLV